MVDILALGHGDERADAPQSEEMCLGLTLIETWPSVMNQRASVLGWNVESGPGCSVNSPAPSLSDIGSELHHGKQSREIRMRNRREMHEGTG